MKSFKFKSLFTVLKKNYNDDILRFRLVVALKVLFISVITLAILTLFMAIFLKINLIFFEANGYSQIKALEEAYYDYILTSVHKFVPFVIVFLIVNYFVGVYIAETLRRPFRMIGEFCDKRLLKDETINFNPNFIVDLKLLTTISEFFFNMIDTIRGSEQNLKIKIPEKFTRIHRPVFEKAFFIHYSFFIIITSVVAIIGMSLLFIDIHESIVALSVKMLDANKSVRYFLTKQTEILNSILWVIVFIHVVLSFLLSLHLYNYISHPAFALFSTMRGFLKGSTYSRVHLISHKFIRDDMRKFNKYLDYLEKNTPNLTNKD